MRTKEKSLAVLTAKRYNAGECVDCGSSKIENFDIMLCSSCGQARRKEARNAAKVKVVTPIRKVSKKMAKDLQDYGVLRRVHLQEHPECQINIPGVCDGQATTVHHCAKRGVNLLKADTFKSACMSCHTFIETKMSAEERREKGFLITKDEIL